MEQSRGSSLMLGCMSHLDDGTVRELLDELAGEMGRTLEQEEVHIAYRDRTWTLKAQ